MVTAPAAVLAWWTLPEQVGCSSAWCLQDECCSQCLLQPGLMQAGCEHLLVSAAAAAGCERAVGGKVLSGHAVLLQLVLHLSCCAHSA
jgi:hypothetical protein